ncbi:hypothetical protein JL09_g5468, partial [Pichia kudriavzevii]
ETIYTWDSANPWPHTSTSSNAVVTESDGSVKTEDIVYVYRSLSTSYTFGTDTTFATSTVTTTINDKATTYLVVDAPTPFTTKVVESNTWGTATEIATTTDANGNPAVEEILIIPSYSRSISEWNKSYSSSYTTWSNLGWTTSTYVVEFAPSYSTSISYWSRTYASTETLALTLTDGLSVYTTTYYYAHEPQVSTVTENWNKPFTTTYTTYGVISTNNKHYTSSEIIVEIPSDPVSSWTTTTSYISDCNSDAVTSTTISTTTISGVETSIGYEYVTAPAPSCYLPPASTGTLTTSSVTVTTDCSSTAVTSTVATTNAKGSATTYVLVETHSPAPSCAKPSGVAPEHHTVTVTTDCLSTTISSTVTTTDSAGKPTTYVDIEVHSPAAS